MKRILSLLWALAAAAVADAAPSGVVSEPMALDIESGARSEEVIGALAYDTLWQGVTNADYRILVNGAVLASGSGAGMVAWHPTKYGTYTLAYQAFVDNVKVGEDMSATFTLAGKDLVNAEITLAADEVLYDGTARCPKVTIVYLAETLVEGADYTLEYENNVNPGVATMTIRGKGRFSDVLEKNFTIRPAGICSLDIESGTRIARTTEPLMYDSCWFAESNSLYKMYVDGKELAQGSGVGANSWTPRGVGDHLLTYRSYSGGYLASDEYQARFRVNGQDLVHATVTFNDETILYDGTERKPSITLTLGGKTLVEGADYSLTYSNNINPGVGIITVTGLGSYVDILDVPFTIRPAGVCFLDIEGGTRTVVGPVPLTYDATWNGDTNQTTRMELLSEKNGGAAETLSDSLTNVGQYDFVPDKDASYKVTLNTYINETLQTDEKIYTATFNYTAPVKPMPAAAVTVTGYSGKYDGEGHGLTVAVDPSVADPTVRYALSAEGPFVSSLLMTNTCGATVWCEVSAPGYIPATNSAIVTITKRSVTLTSGGGSKKYDGVALTNWTFTVSGDDFVGDEGVTCTYSGTQTIVGSSKNTFDYALKSGTTADNYTISKVEGDLEVTATEIVNPFDPDDPTKPVTPEALAKANCVTNYDGDGHSIEVVNLLNPLIAANNPQVTYSLLQNGTYEAQNPVFTNVVSTSVWYRIAADNFKPFTTNALLTIAPRSITKATMAAIADQTYTGSAITPVPTVSDERTLIGAAEPTNIITTADYEVSYADNVNAGTAKIILAGTNNYEGVVTNTFNIAAAPIPFDPTVGITATGYTNAYDGAAHGVSVTATGLKTTATVQYKGSATAIWQDASPTYTDVCDTQVWWKVSAPNYQTVEGTIGLKITSRPVTITSGTKTDFVYDGIPHELSVIIISENGFVAGEGIATSNWATVTTVAEGEVANTFDYAPIEGTKLSNYDITVVTGKIAVVKGTLNPDDDPGKVDPSVDPSDPGQIEDPTIKFSPWDYVGMYDGAAHTVDTNAMRAAYAAVVGEGLTVRYAVGGGTPTLPWVDVAPVFKDVVATSFWYKVSSPNYEDIVHPCKVIITNRCVTMKSADGTWVWDGKEHSTNAVIVTVMDESGPRGARTLPGGMVELLEGETVETTFYKKWSEVGVTSNDFSIAWTGTAKEGNYLVALVTGKLEIVAAPAVTVTIVAQAKTNAYDGVEHRNDGFTWSADNPLFTAEDFLFSGCSNLASTAVCDLKMNLKPSDFALQGTHFASASFVIAQDGTLVVTNATPVTPEGPIDPIDPDPTDPTKPFSKYDFVGMYDGAEHTIDTNALVKVTYQPAATQTFSYALTKEGEYQSSPFVFKDVITTSFWYKISAPNFADYVHQAKVTVTNRPVTVTSGTKLDFAYDGRPHAYTNLTVTAGSFVAGEGIATSNWATVTTVTEGEVNNAFDYAPLAGTKLENYDIMVVTGKIAVVKGSLDPEDDPGKVDPGVDPSDPGQVEDPTIKFSPWDYVGMYDGAVHTVDTNAMRAAYAAVVGEGVSVQYAVGGGTPTLPWVDVAPVFKDVVATSFWYKVSSPNYEDIVHPCKVIITNRCVTMKSADGTWVWDGKEHSTNAVIVTVMDESGPRGARTLPGGMVELLEGETVETTFYKKWSEVGVVSNDFSIAWTGTAKEANYNVTLVTGKLEIVGSAGTYKAVLHYYEDIFMAMAAHVGDRAVVTNEYIAGQGSLLPTDWRGETYDLYDAWNGRAERTFLGWSATNRWTDIYGDDITWGAGEYENGRAIGYVPTGLATNIPATSAGDREFWSRWTYVDTWNVGARDAVGEASDQVKAILDESTGELVLTGLVANASMADGTDPGDSWETFAADTVFPWYNNYRSLIHAVRVAPNVAHIGSWTFCDCASLEEVFFAGGVPACGEGAFANCPAAVGYYPRSCEAYWTNAVSGGMWKGIRMYCREDVPTCAGDGWYVRMDVRGRAQLTVEPGIVEVTVTANPRGYLIVAPNGVVVKNAAFVPQGRTEVKVAGLSVSDGMVTLAVTGAAEPTVYGNASLDPAGWVRITSMTKSSEGDTVTLVFPSDGYRFFRVFE